MAVQQQYGSARSINILNQERNRRCGGHAGYSHRAGVDANIAEIGRWTFRESSVQQVPAPLTLIASPPDFFASQTCDGCNTGLAAIALFDDRLQGFECIKPADFDR